MLKDPFDATLRDSIISGQSEIMTIESYSTLSMSPEQVPHHQIKFTAIHRIFFILERIFLCEWSFKTTESWFELNSVKFFFFFKSMLPIVKI